MKNIIPDLIEKLYFKKWTIGLSRNNIEDIIKNKNFDPDIHWLNIKSYDRFEADPFILESKNGNLDIIFEEYFYKNKYGNISIMSLNNKYEEINRKPVLDIKSHLSYPFIFKEDNRTFIFPESKQSGKLLCYEYVPEKETLIFIKTIIDLPLLDSTIVKHKDKYYIFAAISKNDSEYYLHVFHSDNLLGPYNAHPNNPIKKGLDGTRSAGSFIKVDGILYRPTQNCKEQYGKSITIQRIKELNEYKIIEEPYMDILINNKKNKNVHTIHTLNILDNIIAVDGMRWSFRPFFQIKEIIKGKLKLNN